MTTCDFHSIHLEGLDLAGKTTACRRISTALGVNWQIRRNRLTATNPIYDLADALRRKEDCGNAILGPLYVAAIAADLEGFVSPVQNLIQDSTLLLRSLAYHTVALTPHVVEPLTAMLPRHPRFTFSVVLTANHETRLGRLEERSRMNPEEVAPDDLLIRRDPERFFAMERVLVDIAREHFSATVIDTSSMRETDVVESILAAFHRRCECY